MKFLDQAYNTYSYSYAFLPDELWSATHAVRVSPAGVAVSRLNIILIEYLTITAKSWEP